MATKAVIQANQKRTNVYEDRLVNGATINPAAGAKTDFNVEWPKGPAIYEVWLRLQIVLTVGTAATPITDGILNFIKSIYFKGDNNEVFVDNIPARALMMGPATVMAHTVPSFDQIAASSGTYNVNIPIYAWDPIMVRPEDLFIDTRRYNGMQLSVTVGQMSDLFTTPGTASVVITGDIDVVRSKDDLPDGLKAIGFTSYISQGVFDPTTQTNLALTRADDIFYRRLYVQTASASGFWYGPNSDVVIQKMRVTTSDDNFHNNTDWSMKKARDKQFYRLESAMAGRNVIDFVRDRSNKSALYSDRNNLRLEWDVVSGLAAGNYVSALAQVYRKFKSAA